jgi:hypothetical protein
MPVVVVQTVEMPMMKTLVVVVELMVVLVEKAVIHGILLYLLEASQVLILFQSLRRESFLVAVVALELQMMLQVMIVVDVLVVRSKDLRVVVLLEVVLLLFMQKP